ncbi:hypothetical protein TCE0_017f03414 [Talaromyces pinophilus]|uniref:Pre-mRNA-splicing factor 18 n=1 Tax=Talaromyces pinophilus TaxID=128442 RepID=A0A6V8H1Q4_TALPI|nr:hypothetical protein TCE0_017f03414 [Talaromyces pinophilus]
MDFASLMAKEISKAKPSDTKDKKETGSNNKYQRRADVEAARIAAYNAEQEKLQREREEKAALKRKHEEDELERRREREEKKRKLAEESRKKREAEEEAAERQRRKRLGLPELPPRASEEGTPVPEEEDIDDEELIKKLRELNEPATLFAETHKARLKRYRKLIKRSLTPQLSNGPIPTTLELVPEKDMKIPAKIPKDIDPESRKFLFRQLASYFTMLLEEWAIALAKRDTSVKESFSGRQAFNAMVQSRDNMRPLFKKFETGDIDHTVLEAIVEIVHCAQERRYVDANDGYLRLSIGKAAWPIGVTMVGIHERSAREKLHESDNKAHIMSDEVTRKYLQSIKRCLSFAQVRWPPDDLLQLMG